MTHLSNEQIAQLGAYAAGPHTLSVLDKSKVVDVCAELLERRKADGSARVDATHPVFAFLLGSGPLNNYWFGETPPPGPKNKRKQPFWWRTHLRHALFSKAEGASEALPSAEGASTTIPK